jgi:CRISPR-associated protein Csa3
MSTTALVFVGHTKERIIESIRGSRKYSIEKIILVTGEQESTGEMKSRQIAEELETDLIPFFDVAIIHIDKRDIMRAAGQITGIIRDENSQARDVLINMSGSLRTFSIAAYISGCVTRSRMITAIPKYDKNDNEIGIEDLIDLPPLPLFSLKDEQRRILEGVGDGVESLDHLVMRLNPKMRKNSDAFPKERSRLSHHLKNFEEIGLITKVKNGKNVEVRLTDLGEIIF